MATEDVRDFESSINLIDFKTPTKYACENYAIPLIPAPSLTFSYLPPRDSLDNNPFDQMFKATNKTPKTDDPFEIDYFQHRSGNGQLLNPKSNPLPRKTYSDGDYIRPNDSRSMHDSDFLSPIFTPEKSDISPIPKNGFVTPTTTSQVLRPVSEMRQVDYEKRSPGGKMMKRACSVDAVKDSINVDEIVYKIRNLKRDDSFSNLALNDGFMGSTLGGVSDSKSGFSDIGSDPTIDHTLPQLIGRKSFSARKPTKFELGRSESMLRNLTTKKFNFKERLDQLCLEEEFENMENSIKITDHEELIFQEAKELADTFSKFADESVNIEDVSAPDESIEIELLPNDPNFYQIDELESGLTTGKDIFKQIDKLFKIEPKTEPVATSNIAKVYPTISKTIPPPRVLKDLTNTTADNVKETKITKISGKKRYDAIDLLENLSKLLTEKNSKEDRNGIKEKLVTSLANILNDDNTNPDGFDSNPDGFNSTCSFDEEILNEENVKPPARNKSFVSSEREIAKVAPNVIKRVRAVSFSNSFNVPKVTKKNSNPEIQEAEKRGNFLQKLSQKLRPKKPLEKAEATIPQNAVKPLAKKGPIKAVIPINNMAKVDATKKTLTKAKTLTSLRRISGIQASSTPISGNSNVKAGSSQSTPKSTLSKRRASSSSIGFSPILK